MPSETYRPGRQARIEVDEKIGEISFFDNKTNEFLANHKIAIGVIGKLIKLPKNMDRYKICKYDELKREVLTGFGENPIAKSFIEKIIEKYPRYVRDQLRIIKKSQDIYGEEKLLEALNYCTEHDLFSATDFRDALEYFKIEAPVHQKIINIKIPDKYSAVVAQTRNISIYSKTMGVIS